MMDNMDADVARGYGERSFLSWWNFQEEREREGKPFVVHDVTLRDGEQQAGVIFTGEEKIEIARALARMGVGRIEGGMVAVSAEDRQTLRRLVALDLGAEIWGIARSLPGDIEQAIDIGLDGVGIILLANDQYCKVFGWTFETALEKALRAAEGARSAGLETTLLIADSSRMARRRLREIVERATSSGVYSALALMDTFGALNPYGTTQLITFVRSLTALPVEFHAHNDLGLATANALAGIEAGADVIHTSALGLGERVGNAPLEEVALAASLMSDRPSGLKLGQLCDVTALVQRCSRLSIAENKPVVGSSYARIESGTVAREYARLTEQGEPIQWMFPFDPALIGAGPVELVLGKGSGAANIDSALSSLGLELGADKRRDLQEIVKECGVARHGLLALSEFETLALQAGASRASDFR